MRAWCALNMPVIAMLWLHRTLTQAAITVGAAAEVLEAVALPGREVPGTGIVIVAGGAVGETATRLAWAAVLAMVELSLRPRWR